MSFIIDSDGLSFAPGWFLATEAGVERKTRQIAQDHASVQTTTDGRQYVPMGAIYPSNDSSAEGIIYEDVDVTSGDMSGSAVTAVRKLRMYMSCSGWSKTQQFFGLRQAGCLYQCCITLTACGLRR